MDQLHDAAAITSRERTPGASGMKAGWTPHLAWVIWHRKKILKIAGKKKNVLFNFGLFTARILKKSTFWSDRYV
jgi:hypothetical protein